MTAPFLIQCEQAPLPDRIITDWRRFSSGLWRVPEGDIDAAYSAESFPHVKVFVHDGRLFTNSGCHFGCVILANANCYPLVAPSGYTGPDPSRYSYEGREAMYRGKLFRLGPKVIFTASDPTSAEWQTLLRVLYADGGSFASECTYRQFLAERFAPDSANGRTAHALELTECDTRPMPQTQTVMRQLLEQGHHSEKTAERPHQTEFDL